MIKQILLPIGAVCIFIIIVGVLSRQNQDNKLTSLLKSETPEASVSASPTIVPKNVVLAGKTIKAEIMDNTTLRAKGLSGRTSLDADSGMLFVFDTKKVTPGFWMKDMLIPIDIVWITDGKVSKIDSNVLPPEPGTPDNKLQVYSASRPVDYVLELNANYCNTNKVKVGDLVTLPTL